jgi:murein DD-endopeptidase MepM/ murein hydrolase activator NlpD
MEKARQIEAVLEKYRDTIEPIMELEISGHDIIRLDLTGQNEDLRDIDISVKDGFTKYIESALDNYGKVGIGGYGEDRLIYRHSSLFSGDKEPRSIHLGIDVWVPADTKIYAPINSWVHSFKNNDRFGDYGATIILEHHLNDLTFYTLYGHLSRSSLAELYEGKEILKGDEFAAVGKYEENGQWPPHLHFQLISDMLGYKGDFFGVAPPSEKDYYMNLCPNPEILIKLDYSNLH